MGQYAKFVRPGYVRANATYNPSAGVFVSAYKGGSKVIIVAINNGSSSVSQPFTVQNGAPTSMTPFRSSASENIVQLGAVGLSGGNFTYTLPAQSVTTFTN